MKEACFLLSWLALAGDAGRPAAQDGASGAEILAEAFDGASPAVAAELRTSLLAKGLGAFPFIDHVESRVKTERGKKEVQTVQADLRARIREEFLKDPDSLRPAARKLAPGTLWKLGLDGSTEGAALLYFDAKPYADPARLQGLEYLVCPDPPGDKSYEAWGAMRPDEWAAFSRAFEKAAGPLRLRWRDAGGVWRQETMDKLLPWAAPERNRNGLLLGSNHDETRQPVLSRALADVQVGVPVRAAK